MLKVRTVKRGSDGGFEVKAGDLLSVLKKAKPALSYNDIVPVLSHFCFDRNRVFAYDDISAIEVELDHDSGMECAVPGDALFKVLSSISPDKPVKIVSGSGNIKLSYGRSKLELFTLPRDSFLYDPMEVTGFDLMGRLDGAAARGFIDVLQSVMFSVGTNAASQFELGVNVRFTKKGPMQMLSTDGVSISRTAFGDPMRPGFEGDILLPAFFCNYLLGGTLDTDSKELSVEFNDGSVAALDSSAKVFSRIPFTPDVERINKAIDSHFVGADDLLAVPNREDLSEILNRCIVVSSDDFQNRVTLKFTRTALQVAASGKFGSVSESVPMKYNGDDREVVADPALVRRAILQERLSTWAPANGCLAFQSEKGDFSHFVSTL